MITTTKDSAAVDSPSRVRVLLAEDDAESRTLLLDLLATLGHEIVGEAATGAEAVERAKAVGPDVVLLDVHMPGGSGIEAAERIAEALPGTAVVLFSGDQTLTLSDREVAATTAIAFLPKPVPPRVLDSTLRLAARRARELVSAREDAHEARRALESRKLIERAKGILMRRTGASEAEAYRILQRTSQDRSVPMEEIAKAVLASEP
jgi:two-component system, response regulator PdtaR